VLITTDKEETAKRILGLENQGRGLFTVLERTSLRVRRTGAS
jgi:hypothetical protein